MSVNFIDLYYKEMSTSNFNIFATRTKIKVIVPFQFVC